MGLAYDPNETLKIPSTKHEILETAHRGSVLDSDSASDEEEEQKVPSKIYVAQKLEAEAKAPRERLFRLPNQQVHFLTSLMDKYNDDYKAMARDRTNYYQLTWRQIRSKINTFKGIPEQYAEYLLKKGEILLDDPETIEETRKRIAEENVKKFCAPKPKKIKPKPVSLWQEEDMEDFELETGDKLENITEDWGERVGEGEKKLKLFSDDESDEEGTLKLKSEATKMTVETDRKAKKIQRIDVEKSRKGKELEKLASSDSDSNSEEELEGDEDDEAPAFLDLSELSDVELSDCDILDTGEFGTDSEDEGAE